MNLGGKIKSYIYEHFAYCGLWQVWTLHDEHNEMPYLITFIVLNLTLNQLEF